MFNLRPPRNHTAIPVNEEAIRQTYFTAEEVLLRAGFDNAKQILAALEENGFSVQSHDWIIS